MARLDRHAQRIRSEERADDGGAKDTVRHCDSIVLRASTGHVLQVDASGDGVCLRPMPPSSSGAAGASGGGDGSGALWRQDAAEWSVAFDNAPWTPEWSRLRPFLVGTAVLDAAARRDDDGDVGSGGGGGGGGGHYLVEQALVDDLLSAFSGSEGEYICSRSASSVIAGEGTGGVFEVRRDAAVDRASLALVEKVSFYFSFYRITEYSANLMILFND